MFSTPEPARYICPAADGLVRRAPGRHGRALEGTAEVLPVDEHLDLYLFRPFKNDNHSTLPQ